MKNTDNKKRIKVFTSFEEAESHEYSKKSEVTPLERLASTVILIKKIYDYKPQKYFRIYFDKV